MAGNLSERQLTRVKKDFEWRRNRAQMKERLKTRRREKQARRDNSSRRDREAIDLIDEFFEEEAGSDE